MRTVEELEVPVESKIDAEEYVYMAVSNDKFQLPVAVADSAQELAEKMGVTTGTIYSSICHLKSGTTKNSLYHKVYIGENGEGWENNMSLNDQKLLGEDREKKVLSFVESYIQEHKYPPSTQEIADHIELSASAANRYVRRLIDAGYLETENVSGMAKPIRVKGWSYVRTGETIACGECGEEFYIPAGAEYKYCPHCGRRRNE